ncbi:apyrase [Bactrocera tryoni]|uniref:apyrase n=1 Tax=Bactrocera tryoni TaxID=59916 RepID=UPI001A996C54|nr:apyrase [Bactrocera tryoni]
MKLLTIITLFVPLISADIFPLSIIHINDFHARFEPTDTSGGTCDAGEECIGGLARTIYTVKRLLEEQKDQNPVYFNAGDSFQGTLWYNIGRWNVTSQFLNMLPADAMTLGNHEFDHGIEGVVPFLESINSPMLVANMDARDEPDMQGKYQKSIIIERSNRKIGVIGVILETTYDLANTGNLIFQNESTAIREEAQKLREQGANIIIAITHCGYDVDKLIAQHAADDVDVIVGSHSHTFLYTGDKLPGPDTPYGPYPTEVVHENGHRILIVQAAAYAKYVGNITVYFDDDGNVVDYSGAPIYMGSSVPEDADIVEAMKPWQEIIDAQGSVVVGETKVELAMSTCSDSECNLGNYFCDAMIHAFAALTPYSEMPWANVSIGLINTGGLRVPLRKGTLTYAHLVTMSPFENVLTAFNLPGHKLLEALEFSVQPIDIKSNTTNSPIYMQVAGLKITYNYNNPVGERVVDIKVRCADCAIPVYEDFDSRKIYRIVAPDFLAEGGGGFTMFRDYGSDWQKEMTDIDALLSFTRNTSPIYIGREKRISVLGYPETAAAIVPIKEEMDKVGAVVQGETKVELRKSTCSSDECNLGNFFCDAMIHAFTGLTPYSEGLWSNVSIGIVNTGALRVPLSPGNITYSHIVTMSPFENKLTAFNIPGHKLLEALEYSVSPIDLDSGVTSSYRFIQVSGLKITYNYANPTGERVVDIKVRCSECDIPVYEDFDSTKIYRVVAPDFLAEGGDGFAMFRDYGYDFQKEMSDLDALLSYTTQVTPIYVGKEKRITVLRNEEVLKLKQIWATNITTEGNVVVGTSRVTLSNYNCAQSECNVGNLYTDAILHAFLRLEPYNTHKWANASIAITTSAEMRASIPRGNVTYKEAFELCSYEGDLIAFDLAGKYLLEALEYSVSSIDLENNVNETYKFLHSSGIRVTYDLRAAKEDRVVSADVRCTDCAIPFYESLSPNKTYRIVAAKYLATGGYGYSMFTNYGSSRNTLPVNELTALIDYFRAEKPITIGLQGRIKLI